LSRLLDFFMPETASAPPKARARYIMRSCLAGLPLGGLVGASLVDGVPEQVLVVAPVLIIILVYEFSMLMRALDELQFRIHMTALALSGGIGATLMTSWAILVAVDLAPRSDIELIFGLPVLGLGYYAALFFVSRRYA
jgi:hypothetical protein